MRRIAVQLSEEERQTVALFRTQGVHLAREVNRAHILAALHNRVPDQHIKAVLARIFHTPLGMPTTRRVGARGLQSSQTHPVGRVP